jgi:hypothetical protein
MLTDTMESVSREAARLLQIRVGGNYQANQLHEYAQREAEDIWDCRNWRETLRAVELTAVTDRDWLVLPAQYQKIVDTYTASTVAEWVPVYSSEDAASKRIQTILQAGGEPHWTTGRSGVQSAVFAGDQCVLIQPTAAEKLQVCSDNAADISMQILVIGEDSNGVIQREVVTTNGSDGTTKVDSSKTYLRIDKISTGSISTRVGSFTISGKTSATTYSIIAPADATTLYAKYQLGATATADTTVYAVCKLRFQRIQDEIELAPIPGTEMAMVYGICAKAMLEKRQNDYARDYMSLRETALGKVKAQHKDPSMLKMLRC